MIKPLQQGTALLGDISRTQNNQDGFRLWWLGQSGFLIQWQGKHLLLDPYLSDSLTKKYAATDKPHERMTELVIDPAKLDFIDVVTSSHNHTDHLDAETLNPLRTANPALDLVIPEANRAFVADRLATNIDWPIGLTAGASTIVSDFTFHGIPAAHNDLATDEQDRHKFMGYVVEFGGYTIYHSGDTLLYDGMLDWLKSFNVDVAMLPINGNKPERRVAGNLDGTEAAQLAKDLTANLVIPCHYEMFTFNTADPVHFMKACNERRQPFRVMLAGQGLTYNHPV